MSIIPGKVELTRGLPSHLGVEGPLGTPPPYVPPAIHGTSNNVRETPLHHPASQFYEENEYGEMRPTSAQASDANSSSNSDTDSHPAGLVRVPSDVIYVEDEYGEIHPEKVEREHHHHLHLRNHRGSSRSRSRSRSAEQPREVEENHFDEDAQQGSAELRPDGIYPENRFGELGRADTITEEHTHLTDRIKETAERLVGKLTSHRERNDKGVEQTTPTTIA